MSSLTPEMFDLLIIVVIIFGVALAIVRLYADFSRRLPPESQSQPDDTQQNEVVN
jgi:cytochrome c oxidase assembly protein Cox11